MARVRNGPVGFDTIGEVGDRPIPVCALVSLAKSALPIGLRGPVDLVVSVEPQRTGQRRQTDRCRRPAPKCSLPLSVPDRTPCRRSS